MPQQIDWTNVPRGAVLNSYGEGHRNLIAKFAYAQIRGYQKRKYPDASLEHVSAVHSQIHLGSGQFLSVESPRARIHEPVLEDNHRYTLWVYKHTDKFDDNSWRAFEIAVDKLVGTPYDYGQLLDILVNQVFGWTANPLKIFDLGRRRKVCSVACHVCLLAAYKAIPESARPSEAPLGRQHVEVTCPADFENHDSFVKFVAE